jgi:hypothetical protein
VAYTLPVFLLSSGISRRAIYRRPPHVCVRLLDWIQKELVPGELVPGGKLRQQK